MISWENPWGTPLSLGHRLRTFPLYLVWILVGFVSGWVQTRRTSTLILGCPALIAAFVVTTLAVRAREGLTSETVRRYTELAQERLRQHQVDEAEFFINRLKPLGSPSDSILAIHAEIAVQRQRPDLAEQVLESMLENSDRSRDPFAHRQIALIKLSSTKSPISSRANEAVAHLEAALSATPTDIEGHQILAQLYLDRSQLEDAARHLEMIVTAHPVVAIDLARIFSRLDRNARKLEFAAQAASFYAKAFAPSATQPVILPEDRTAGFLQWTEALTMVGRLDQVVDLLTKELDRNNSPQLRKRLAETYVLIESQLPRAENWARRMELCNLCRNYDPDAPQGLVMLANIAAHGPQDLAIQAERDLQPYLDADKAPAAAYFLIGTAASQKQDFPKALEFLRKAVQMEPRADISWNNLAQTLASMTPPDLLEAERCIGEALAINSAPAAYHETRGQIMVKLERWPEAVRDLETALQQIPADSQIHRGLAMAYEQLGDQDLAEFHSTRHRALGQ
jgi:tetratricopeptide (TPR) repeat protein